ncbi:hypothetical protein DJ64_24020 [Streptomyces griseorubens]|uniref:Uncharacterized protein n=1 Tax=Streptomyces griseorubens TaxID=66897 RepID=A0ABR4SSG8_9ACTN|nr:hypothetical protein DJ64_24020 [Streptomyces griseorubens]
MRTRRRGSARAKPAHRPSHRDLGRLLPAGWVQAVIRGGGRDVITGAAHRHSLGCSSLVTDGSWLWRG